MGHEVRSCGCWIAMSISRVETMRDTQFCMPAREEANKYDVLTILPGHGAPVNAPGINDWTPAHMAANFEDKKG